MKSNSDGVWLYPEIPGRLKSEIPRPALILATPSGGFATVRIAESTPAKSRAGTMSNQRGEGCQFSVLADS